jgi:signal transduction histidine kinase
MLTETDVLKSVIQVNTTNFATGFENIFENIYTNNISDSVINSQICQNIINPVRFFNDESGYFFVETDNAWMVAHATKPELIGTYRMDVQDINGKYYVRDMVEAIRYKGYGFVDYYFENPKNGLISRKLSFVKSIPAAGFFIGTGFYNFDQSYYFTKEEAAKAVVETATISMAQGLSGGFEQYDDSVSKVDFCRMFIDKIRFFDNQSGYFFVYDFNCVNVAHGTQKELQGENLYDYQDSKGNYVVRGLANIAKTQGSGYYDYYWNNPVSGNEEPKTAFVYKIPGIDYFIGSGIYY